MDYLITARPTAVNISDAAFKLKIFLNKLEKETTEPAQFKKK